MQYIIMMFLTIKNSLGFPSFESWKYTKQLGEIDRCWNEFFYKISPVTEENCHKIEENTVQQGNERKYWMTQAMSTKYVFVKKNYETLTETFLNPITSIYKIYQNLVKRH